MVRVHNLQYSYRSKKVLDGVGFHLQRGELVFLLGKNGAGKTTLFKCLLGILPDYSGEIYIEDRNLKDIYPREISTLLSYMPQSSYPAFNFSVLDMVLLGLAHRIPAFGHPKKEDMEAARRALEAVGIGDLAGRSYAKISGGERQLTLIARAIAQDARIWIMDEPVSNLDYGNQIRLLGVLRDLSQKGYLIVLSSHNPEQCFQFADKVLVMEKNRIAAQGDPAGVLTSELIGSIYDLEVSVLEAPVGGVRFVVPNRLLKEDRV